MQQPALAQRGRSGLDRDALEAIYVGLLFYRLKRRTVEAGDQAFSELGGVIDRLRAMDTVDVEGAIKHEVAEVLAHSNPDSGLAVLLRLWALAGS